MLPTQKSKCVGDNKNVKKNDSGGAGLLRLITCSLLCDNKMWRRKVVSYSNRKGVKRGFYLINFCSLKIGGINRGTKDIFHS